MNYRAYSYLSKLVVFSLGGFCILSVAQAGEKIRFSDSPEQVDVPKPTTRDERISNRFGKSPSSLPQAEVSTGVEPAQNTTRPTSNPLMSQKIEEYLDKKKNWMFIDPKEKDKDKLGSDQVLQANEISLDAEKKKPKTVQEQFYEHPSDNLALNKKNSSSKDRLNSDQDEENGDHRAINDKGSLAPELSLGSLLKQNERTDGVLRSVSDLSRANALGSFAPEPTESARKADRERDIKQHDADFAQIIAPRASGSSFAGSSDPANTQTDITRQEVNPFAPRRGFGSYGATQSGEPSQSISAGSNIPRVGGSDSFASRLPSAPSFSSPSVSASPAPSFQPERKPIFFTPPHRNF